MMKILITGGAGFIGSHLAESLLNDKHEIIIVDNLSTGNKQNIAHLEHGKKFHFYRGSILDHELMRQLVRNCDCIYHLAAAVGVKYVMEHPLESLLTNVRGTEIVLELANKYRKKIFITSSSEVYGKNGKRPLRETDDRVMGRVTIPRWGYACSKAFDEFLSLAYQKDNNLQFVVGRLFNICGPRQSPSYGMVIPRFVEQALQNEPLSVYGNGRQIRSFTYIDDAVKAMKLLMQEPKAAGGIFNVGNFEHVRIIDLARKIKSLCRSKSKIKFIPYTEAFNADFEDMHYRVPDISQLQEVTGYVPKVNLEQMLKIIIGYTKEALFE